MSHIEEPELHVIRFPDNAGAERRAEAARQHQETRRRYIDHLAKTLQDSHRLGSHAERAAVVIDTLTEWNDITTGDRCACGCHPRLPSGDLHDFGFACPCQMTLETRRRNWDELFAEMDAFWASPEGEEIAAEEEAEDRTLASWLADHPEVEVRSRGGWAPEQWRGVVDGHSFYFRERHDHWRIELDLRPTGKFSTVWVGGDFDEANFEPREIEAGDVIAEGTTAVDGYGDSPVARLQFIVRAVRAHVRQQTCTVHTTERATVEELLGRPMAWCPSCGANLRPTTP